MKKKQEEEERLELRRKYEESEHQSIHTSTITYSIIGIRQRQLKEMQKLEKRKRYLLQQQQRKQQQEAESSKSNEADVR